MIWPKVIFDLFQWDDHALGSSVSSCWLWYWALSEALCSTLTDIVVAQNLVPKSSIKKNTSYYVFIKHYYISIILMNLR